MTIGKSIFGLRFGSHEEISPSREELDSFLGGPKREEGTERHADDLAIYRDKLARIDAYEQRRLHEVGQQDFRERVYYGVLRHSCFFNLGLKLAIEQYKYHVHAFTALDLRKPASFVKSAEGELANLNPRGKDAAAKRVRLQGMIEERKDVLDRLANSRDILSRELIAIIRYISANLTKIERLTEAALAAIEESRISGTEEKREIADVKTQFKEQLKDALHQGLLTKEHVAAVKRDVDQLTGEISSLAHKDLDSLTRMYGAIHDHVAKYSTALNCFVAGLERQDRTTVDEEKAVFRQVEQLLVELISDHQFPVKTAPIHSETPYEDLLREKRNEMLGRIFELLRRDRRSRHDRRSGRERRVLDDPELKFPDRRVNKDRRSGKIRR
jgi:predicted transcriptional regulator